VTRVADPASMVAGYAQPMRGRASYSGVLRNKSKTRIWWTCPHDHTTAHLATLCASGELARRLEGVREVITLGWCEPCKFWWTPEQALGPRPRGGPPRPLDVGCPRCDVPLETVKLMVLERKAVS